MTNRMFSLGILFLLFTCSLHAKEYHIENVTIQAYIHSNGNVTMTEARTYEFEDDFSWANYTLDRRGFKDVTDISVRDESTTYVHKDTEAPGTFRVTYNEKEINLKWFFQAEDVTRTFTIEYTLRGALAIGTEWTEFFWNFIGDEWKKTTQHATVRLYLPTPVGQDSLYSWIRTMNTNTTLEQKRDGLFVTVDYLRSSQALKIRTLFPTALLSNPAITVPELMLADAQSEEETYQATLQERREHKAHYASLGRYLTILIAMLSLVLFVYFYRRYGMRHTVRAIPETLYTPPSTEPPAIIGWLMQKSTVNGSHLVATLFDLARRGLFTIHEEEGEKKFLQKEESRFRIEQTGETPPEDANLLDWERDLYEYVMEHMESGSVYFDELTDQRSDMSKWFSEWAKKVKADAKSHQWIDPKSIKGAIIHGILQFVLLGTGILAIYWADLFGLIALFAAVIFGFLSFAIVRRTQSGEKIYRQWKAFTNGIKKGDHHQFNRKNIDTMFVYALALGVSEKHLEIWLSDIQVQQSYIPWIIFMHGTTNPATIAGSMTTLAGTGLQTVSSVAGGTGATAGSAGGGTGGGAG